MGSMMYMMNLPLPAGPLQAAPDKPGDHSSELGSPVNCNSEEMMMMAASPRETADILKPGEHLCEPDNCSPRAKELTTEPIWKLWQQWFKMNICHVEQRLQPPRHLTMLRVSMFVGYMHYKNVTQIGKLKSSPAGAIDLLYLFMQCHWNLTHLFYWFEWIVNKVCLFCPLHWKQWCSFRLIYCYYRKTHSRC